MPFERYLRLDDGNTVFYQDHNAVVYGQQESSPHHQSHALQFQIPLFMLNGPPTLAPGGGAEVLPAGLLDSTSDSFGSSWFANNGFAPFNSAPISKITSSAHPDDSKPIPHSLHPRSLDPRWQSLPEAPSSLRAYIPNISSPSAGSFNTHLYSQNNALVPHSASSLAVTTPSPRAISVYSASGFDILSILSRVVNRTNPTVQLGPVDLSCSFVIVDVRRYDYPIVYASPTFCHLTGYSEQEVLGRNCRFLQSPTGDVGKGEPRRFVSSEAVSYMRKSLSSSKECQTTLINYRKGGQAFINLVTVIPLRGGVHNTVEEADEVAYHIGFQVDLTEQPNRILDRLRDGTYHNSSWAMRTVSSGAGPPSMYHGLGQLVPAHNMTNVGTKGGRHGQMMSLAVSKELRNLLADTTFTDSVRISTGTNMSGPTSTSNGSTEQERIATVPLTMLVTPSSSASMKGMSTNGNTTAGSMPVSLSPSLSLLLLEFLPDFVLVLSLKGAFLYVGPSVRMVLGYEAEELVGKSISDVCHPADLVPLMRELKEGSVNGLSITGTSDTGSSGSNLVPKSVDLLFRALPKVSTSTSSRSQERHAEQDDLQPSSSPGTSEPSGVPPYVWLECRGRLHVEPGKGRKAIILSGRARWMPVVRWGTVYKAVGLGGERRHRKDIYTSSSSLRVGGTFATEVPRAPSIDSLEFWAMLSSQGTFLVASASVRDVLGWGTGELIGRNIWGMVRDSRSGLRDHVEAEMTKLEVPEANNTVDPLPTVVTTSLIHREFHEVPVRLVFYRTPRTRNHGSRSSSIRVGPTPLVHPLNSPVCPVVCQATVLSDTEYQSGDQIDNGFSGCRSSQVKIQIDDSDTSSSMHPPDASIFEELESTRGSSWQYELQQLKFANQRLREELHALEASCGAGVGSSGMIGGGVAKVPFDHAYSSSSIGPLAIPQEEQPTDEYASLMYSTLPTSLPSLGQHNSLHERDPPTSEWSSLAGATGQGTNSRKRAWRADDGPTSDRGVNS